MDPEEYLAIKYLAAFEIVSVTDEVDVGEIALADIDNLNLMLSCSEQGKAVFTVLFTSIVYKVLHPEQDIRRHQAGMTNGYSGRVFDKSHITPFLRKQKFPAMAESGWLTRSLEQNTPYTLNYGGSIRPKVLKTAFLELLDSLENGDGDAEAFLEYLLQSLILKRNAQTIDLAKPTTLPIHKILDLLNRHFYADYSADGAARLPVLALYAAYECLVTETQRYKDKTLLPIESHTSADLRSGRIGDVQVDEDDGTPFEAVEVKFEIPISVGMVRTAYDKFSTTQVKRYYILSTASADKNEVADILAEIEKIKNIHGCNVIINGVLESVAYYLRLLDDPSKFIARYVDLIETDTALKFEHKQQWNSLVSLL